MPTGLLWECERGLLSGYTREHWLSAETLRHIAADGSVVRGQRGVAG